VFVEQARLLIPDGLAAGQYRLGVGWYDATTFRRLPVSDATNPDAAEDMALLPTVVAVDH
jgi:hypothetical protein